MGNIKPQDNEFGNAIDRYNYYAHYRSLVETLKICITEFGYKKGDIDQAFGLAKYILSEEKNHISHAGKKGE